MNTIPLTFNEHQINRTIFGGKQNNDKNALNISVILLNSSSGIFKNCLFENLLQCNFCSIICVEQKFSNSTSIDNLSKKFPTVKFILLLEDSTEGEMINIAMGEVESDFVLVIKDSLYIPNNVITPHLAERLLKYDAFCLVPRLLDSEKNGVSCAYKPSIDGKKFVIEEFSIIRDGIKTIYAFDNIGLYNRKKFIQLGGFDWTIKNSYWQNLDFFMRSWLWGEQTILTTLIQFSYINDVPVEDRTINIDYL